MIVSVVAGERAFLKHRGAEIEVVDRPAFSRRIARENAASNRRLRKETAIDCPARVCVVVVKDTSSDLGGGRVTENGAARAIWVYDIPTGDRQAFLDRLGPLAGVENEPPMGIRLGTLAIDDAGFGIPALRSHSYRLPQVVDLAVAGTSEQKTNIAYCST